MAEPRYVVPNLAYFLTRRCYQRTQRLRPSAETNEIVAYALAWAARKTGVVIHAACVMSNHLHVVATDPRGVLPTFMREFHRMAAKVLNAAQGQWENLWSAEKPNAQIIADPAAAVDRIAYLVSNPVAAGLVRTPAEWPGVLLWKPGVHRVKRPKVYFDPAGKCPEELELRIERPRMPGCSWTAGDWDERTAKAIRARVEGAWAKVARAGRKFLGRVAVLATSFLGRAESYERKRSSVPRIAAVEPTSKRTLEALRKTFLASYRSALRKWCEGDRRTLFPEGTWWMAQHHRAPVEVGA